MLFNGAIINPDQYLVPCYKLSPFSSSDIGINNALAEKGGVWKEYFARKHPSRNFMITKNGRQALSVALKCLDLKGDDVVTILTSSQGFYISSCVTTEIEKICYWSREIVTKTKVLLVNHEFGFPYEDLQTLKNLGYPIIEDCAYAFNSQNKENSVGLVGDFVIYSLPKFFPVQVGGVLISKMEMNETVSDAGLLNYVSNVLDNYLPKIKDISKIRRQNYKYLMGSIKKIGLSPRFLLSTGCVPGAFFFCVNNGATELKDILNSHGIENSVFYRESVLFIPCHHRLKKVDLDYFINVIDFHVNKIKNENV